MGVILPRASAGRWVDRGGLGGRRRAAAEGDAGQAEPWEIEGVDPAILGRGLDQILVANYS